MTVIKYEIVQNRPDDFTNRFQVIKYYEYLRDELTKIKTPKFKWFPWLFYKTVKAWPQVLKQGNVTEYNIMANYKDGEPKSFQFTLDEAKQQVAQTIFKYKENQRLQNFVPLIITTYYI